MTILVIMVAIVCCTPKEIEITQELTEDTVVFNFCKESKGLEWDQLYIVRPYSNFENEQVDILNIKKISNLSNTDIYILVVYVFDKKIVGFSKVPRSFDLLALFDSKTDNLVEIDKDLCTFKFEKNGVAYQLVL